MWATVYGWRHLVKATEVTAGQAESNGSLLPGGWLKVTCELTACTPGSALDPTLNNDGRTLPLPLIRMITIPDHVICGLLAGWLVVGITHLLLLDRGTSAYITQQNKLFEDFKIQESRPELPPGSSAG